MKFNIVKFKPKQIKGLECLNCGQPLLGNENFCSYCGQKNSIKKLNFDSFLKNLFSGLFSYDSRFWRTFIPLLTKPGKVSKDYIEGKRVRFVNPFQLYLNVSIIFFLLLGIFNRMDNNNVQDNILTFNNNLDSISQQGTQQIDSALTSVKEQVINFAPIDSTNIGVVTDFSKAFDIIESKQKEAAKEYVYNIKSDTTNNIGVFKKLNDFQHYHDSFPTYTNEQGLDSLGYKKTFWNKLYYQQVIKTTSNIKQLKTKDGVNNLIKKLTSYISISLFVFLPIFTLFLKVLYIRRKFTYMEHLVFVFHTQTVFFLLLVIFILLSIFFTMQNMLWIFILLFLLYLYKALRHFYQQGRLKTIVKYVLLNSYYMFLAGIGFAIVAILSIVIS
jgi:hypothetical protein